MLKCLFLDYALLILIWSKNYQYRNFFLRLTCLQFFCCCCDLFCSVLFCLFFIYLSISLRGVRISVHFTHNHVAYLTFKLRADVARSSRINDRQLSFLYIIGMKRGIFLSFYQEVAPYYFSSW